MLMKNLILYTVPKGWLPTEEALQKFEFQPCAGLELSSRGWAPVHEYRLHYLSEGQVLLNFTSEKKVIPASYVEQLVKAKAAEIEADWGHRPGRKQMKEIKGEVIDQLIPKAFTVRKGFFVWIDSVNGSLAVGTRSVASADQAIGLLFRCFDDLKIQPLKTKTSPSVAMTTWLMDNDCPVFTIDMDCELRSRGESGAAVRYLRHCLESKEIGDHIKAGKEAEKLAMTYADRISFTLDKTGQLRKITMLDLALKELPGDDDDQFQSEFFFMTSEYSRLIKDLVTSLGGLVAQDDEVANG